MNSNTTTLAAGSRWASKATGFLAEIRGITAGHVRYGWVDITDEADFTVVGQLTSVDFLDRFEPV